MENKTTIFYYLVANLIQNKKEIACQLKDESDRLCQKIDNMLEILRVKEIPRMKQCLQDVFEEDVNADPMVLRNKIQKVIKMEISKGFDLFRNDFEEVISNNIQETVNHFLSRFNDIVYEFKTATEILFETSISRFEFSMKPIKDNGFYCSIRECIFLPDEKFEFVLRTYLPQSIRRRLILYEMIESMASNVNRNCDRIRGEFKIWIHTMIDYYSQQQQDLENCIIEQISHAVQRYREKQGIGSESMQMELKILANKAKTVEEYKERLANVECH